jgi:hypothetical protein
MTAPLLFLDFDGVLHPKGCATSVHFVHLPRLEQLLRATPPVRIVISSTWQYIWSFDGLRRKFSPDIAARIIGGTQSADPDGEAESRYQTIRMYLRHAGELRTPWIALDDARHEFPEDCAQLVSCETEVGFDDEAAGRLRRALGAL